MNKRDLSHRVGFDGIWAVCYAFAHRQVKFYHYTRRLSGLPFDGDLDHVNVVHMIVQNPNHFWPSCFASHHVAYQVLFACCTPVDRPT
jgi:hypothetical protein